MLLKINEQKEILEYATIGGMEGAIEFDGVIPDGFEQKFKPSFYMLQDDKIIENSNYVEPSNTPPVTNLSQQDEINAQIMLTQAKQKEDQDKFNAQILLKLAGGMK